MNSAVLQGKQIVLGVTGSIAAYKAADIASQLMSLGAQVQPVMTANSTRFIQPVTLRTLTGRTPLVDLFQETVEGEIAHLGAIEKADLLLIAPASANVLAKLACGIADDMLTTLALAAKCPILVAPAMNTNMWTNPIVLGNVDRLAALGFHFVGPVEGHLACGMTGMGKMSSPESVVNAAISLLAPEGPQDLLGVTFLITAGPTREPIDPVRYVSNYSTGRMGFAIAEAAQSRGGEVILVTGPAAETPPAVSKVVQVETAAQMLDAVNGAFKSARVIIGAAAVSDFSPRRQEHKIKKADTGSAHTITLEETADILAKIGEQKGDRVLVGFALETRDLAASAMRKMQSKNLDMVVANLAGEGNQPFGSGPSEVRIITRGGEDVSWPRMSKTEIADQLLTFIRERFLLHGRLPLRGD